MNINIEKDLHLRAKQYAVRNGIKLSSLVEQCIAEKLNEWEAAAQKTRQQTEEEGG